MVNIIFFFIYLVASTAGHRIDSMQSKVKENLDIERPLKLMDQAPIKSIHTKFGYIVDCIDIKKQYAFDHPLLMNHKLQIKPSFQNKIRKTHVKKSSTQNILGFEKDQCPIGTVPIRRTTQDDLIRAKSFFSNISYELISGIHVARVTLGSRPDNYYGVGGINSVFSLKVEKSQSSTSIMWVRNGPIDNTNLIGIGWHVAPELYNNDASHMFAVWTTDNFKKTGCFNLQCSGFVQQSKTQYLGAQFDKTSILDGEFIEIKLAITEDPVTKNWWLFNEDEPIGYFPSALFTNLTSADQVGWGGRTTNLKGASSPPMGAGLFPNGGDLSQSCYFRNITFQNGFRKDYLVDETLTEAFSDNPRCYLAEYYGDKGGFSLEFGGPGGNCDD